MVPDFCLTLYIFEIILIIRMKSHIKYQISCYISDENQPLLIIHYSRSIKWILTLWHFANQFKIYSEYYLLKIITFLLRRYSYTRFTYYDYNANHIYSIWTDNFYNWIQYIMSNCIRRLICINQNVIFMYLLLISLYLDLNCKYIENILSKYQSNPTPKLLFYSLEIVNVE